MQPSVLSGIRGRGKFIVGGLVVLAAVVYLIVSSTRANAQYFITVSQVRTDSSMAGRNLRISGAVDGKTIHFDPQTGILTFQIADVPADNAVIAAQGGLSKVLHEAVVDPSRSRLTVVYKGAQPDLLRDEAQAIVTGHLGTDGNFYADPDGLLLKCPTKYQEAVPSQASGN